ncbi:peptide chain release factor N(5)-glutamine methyltransferase [Chryseolinea sp. T2]|uniref:peptide chain release factor N(5)-glutamine methyltransferase n=1 Tax=Chryseolinea sp. T2 TaxID=3129255 RepID=UPI0030782F86
MKNSKSLLLELVDEISLEESDPEKRAIATYLMESICELSPADLLSGKTVPARLEAKLHEAVKRINLHEPLQYVLHEAHFFGRKFYVDPAVLIPRPETEELVGLILDHVGRDVRDQNIVDVATGSGCIAITLAIELPNMRCWGTDISKEALAVARRNGASLQANVNLVQNNILTDALPVHDVAILVSNPPYIADREKLSMQRNVLEHEPHLALFVPDNNPLLFYEAIATHGVRSLIEGGLLAVEINERFGNEVAALMANAGLQHVELVKDLAGKDRFVFSRKGH